MAKINENVFWFRRRKTEDGRRKTEDGRRKTEDGRRDLEFAIWNFIEDGRRDLEFGIWNLEFAIWNLKPACLRVEALECSNMQWKCFLST